MKRSESTIPFVWFGCRGTQERSVQEIPKAQQQPRDKGKTTSSCARGGAGWIFGKIPSWKGLSSLPRALLESPSLPGLDLEGFSSLNNSRILFFPTANQKKKLHQNRNLICVMSCVLWAEE